ENGNNGGDLLGAGGRVLSNEEVATIQAEQRNIELENFSSQSFLARMFDTNLSNSFTNQFIARVPMSTFTNSANIFSLPSTAIASLSGTLSPTTQAQPGPLNPHNL